MPAQFTVDGDIVTIRMEWVVPLEFGQDRIEYKAMEQFDRGAGNHGTEEEPRTFDDLSNQEKLDIVFEYITNMVNNDAKAKARLVATKLAGEASDAANADGDWEV